MESGLYTPELVLGELGIEPGMSVVDLGTGAGHFALAAAHMVIPGGHVYALDVQRELLEKVQKQAEDQGIDTLTVVWGDIEKTGGTMLRDDSIDKAVIANVLFQLQNIEAALREVLRILKPGAQLLIIGWSDGERVFGPRPEDVVSQAEVRTLTEGLGFRFVRDVAVGKHHYGFMLHK